MAQQSKRQAARPVATTRPPDPVDLSIGLRVRLLRQQRALSLQTLAQQTGLSIGFISQVERGLSSPSVRDLMRISAALGTDFNVLVDTGRTVSDPAADSPIVRLEDRRDIAFFDGVLKQLLTPPTGSALFLYMVTIEPHGRAGDAPYVHAGEEAGLVLQGRLLLTIDGTDHLLNEGDSFRFVSTTPHRFSNPTGSVTRVLWVNVKPPDTPPVTP